MPTRAGLPARHVEQLHRITAGVGHQQLAVTGQAEHIGGHGTGAHAPPERLRGQVETERDSRTITYVSNSSPMGAVGFAASGVFVVAIMRAVKSE